MFAEIYKKTPKSERWEDVLTSSFFGPIRYTTTFESVLKKILIGVEFKEEAHREEFLQTLENLGDDWEIRFWEKINRKEIDVLIISKKSEAIIGIEIKYGSELSGEEQLSNYAKLLSKEYNKYSRFLIFLAKDISAKTLYETTYKGVLDSDHCIKGFGYASWQIFYRELNKIKTNNHPDKLIVTDLLKYLKFKNLDGFIEFDYEKLTSKKINLTQKYYFS